jgi:adenylate cyclase
MAFVTTYSFASYILRRWYWVFAVVLAGAVWAALAVAMRPLKDADGSFATHPYGLTTQLENHALDLLFQLRDVRQPEQRARGLNEPITIIDIDERSIKAAKVRPQMWPRNWYARLIDRSSNGGASVIGLDILLSEEGGTSVEDRLRDQQLAYSISNAGNVVIARKSAGGGYEAIEPLPVFANAAWAVGLVDAPIDRDGFVRSMPVFLIPRTGEDLPLSFAARLVEGYRAAEGFDRKFAELTGRGVDEEEAQKEAEDYAQQSSQLKKGFDDSVLSGDRKLVLRNDRFLQLDFRGRTPAFRRVSAADLLFDERAQIPDDLFRNQIVLIGASYLASGDLYPTPFYESSVLARMLDRKLPITPARTPGVELHATAVASMLFSKSLARPRYGWQIAGLMLPLGLVGLAVFWPRPLWGLLAVVLIATASLIAASWVFNAQGVILPLADAWLGLVLLTPMGLGAHYARERVLRAETEVERRLVMDIFSRFVSEDVAAEMWERRGQSSFAGERHTVTVIFTDIRGFTTLSESVSSETVVEWLNDYFGRMYAVITAHGGHINKFIGDGLMIVFGAPIDRGQKQEARSAVACGLAMLAEVEKMNQDWKVKGRPQLKIGVGINTGEATCGVVGARQRLEYTLIGDTVNLASRLESTTKELGVPIIISESTARLLGDEYQVRSLGSVKVRGKTVSTSVHTVERKQAESQQSSETVKAPRHLSQIG